MGGRACGSLRLEAIGAVTFETLESGEIALVLTDGDEVIELRSSARTRHELQQQLRNLALSITYAVGRAPDPPGPPVREVSPGEWSR